MQSRKSVQRVHHFADDVESTIAGIEDKLGLAVSENQKRFFAIKLLERDSKISEVLKSAPNVDAEIKALEDKYDDDRESIITNERYQYISSIIGSCVKKARAGKETVSDKIDRIVTNRFLALPIFALIMWAVYYVAVSSLGGIVTDWTNDTLFGEWIQPAVQTFMENVGCSEWLVSLVVDGIIGGLGAPIGFAPQMAIVFLFLSILEDCGYMARVAFIMDRIFRRFGLSKVLHPIPHRIDVVYLESWQHVLSRTKRPSYDNDDSNKYPMWSKASCYRTYRRLYHG